MRSRAEPRAVELTRLSRALLASGTEFWARSWEIGLRHARLAPDPAKPPERPRPPSASGRYPLDAYRHYAAEMALVPWLAAERFREELAGGRRGRAKSTAPVAGKAVPLPARTREANQGLAVYTIPTGAAQQVLQERGAPFLPVSLGLGRAVAALTGVRYASSDLGTYDEIGVALLVVPQGNPWAPGLHFIELLVNSRFSCEAGKAIWGYPKTEAAIEVTFERSRVSWTVRQRAGGAHVLTIAFPRGGEGSSTAIPLRTYTVLGGKPHRAAFVRTGRGERIRAGDGKVTVTLGGPGPGADHRLRKTLRQLGLPRAPLILHAWTERMSGELHAPLPLT